MKAETRMPAAAAVSLRSCHSLSVIMTVRCFLMVSGHVSVCGFRVVLAMCLYMVSVLVPAIMPYVVSAWYP